MEVINNEKRFRQDGFLMDFSSEKTIALRDTIGEIIIHMMISLRRLVYMVE